MSISLKAKLVQSNYSFKGEEEHSFSSLTSTDYIDCPWYLVLVNITNGSQNHYITHWIVYPELCVCVRSGAELPDARRADGPEPGEVSGQRAVWLLPQASLHVPEGHHLQPGERGRRPGPPAGSVHRPGKKCSEREGGADQDRLMTTVYVNNKRNDNTTSVSFLAH